jgi:uncharacterized membrane protein YkvA (DUF1232 family)
MSGYVLYLNSMMVKRPKIRPWMLKKEIIVLYYAMKDKRTSLLSKIPALVSVLYLLSPIDLIPDFIPFAGYLDDLVVVPLLLNLSIRLLPEAVREESIVLASRNKRKFQFISAVIVVLLLALLTGIFLLVRNLFINHG